MREQSKTAVAPIALAYAGNVRAFDGMVISLLSVVRHCSDPLRVFLLTMDLRERNPAFLPLTEAHRAYLEEICRTANAESRVELLDAGPYYRETLLDSPNADTSYTPYCFLRLYADRFPQLPDKLIYLDTDTVLCDDLRLLWEEDVSGVELAGVRDRYGCHFFGINYLNSGVLLLNLARIRRTQLFRRVLQLCGEKKIFLPDQTALHRLTRSKRILPRRYNEQKREREDTVIRHFSMTIRWIPFRTQNVKPWQPDAVREILKTHYYDTLLDEYVRRRPHFPSVRKENP